MSWRGYVFLCSDTVHECGDLLEGVAYHPEGLVFYSSGLQEYKDSGGDLNHLNEGRFVIKYRRGDLDFIKSDKDGNELVFYYSDEKYWCISSSYLALVLSLKRKNIPITVSKLELSKVFIQTSLFEQPYNKNFSVKGVKLLDKNEVIVVSELKISIFKSEEESVCEEKGVIERVAEFVNYSRFLISNLVNNCSVDLELSGGVDSRIVLGLALPYKDEICVSSDKNRKNDYVIAGFLSSFFKIKIKNDKTGNYGVNDNQEKWFLYKLANIGVSRTNPNPNSGSGVRFSTSVRLNGAGGGSGKVFYNINEKAYLSLIERSPLEKRMKDLLKEDFLGALHGAGFDRSPQRAMVKLYTDYRQRLFAGRAWYSSLLGVIYSPMSGSRFKKILNAPDICQVFNAGLDEILEKNLLSLFILCVLDESLSLIRFDEKSKDFEIKDIIEFKGIAQFCKKKISEKVNCVNKVFGGVRDGAVYPNWLAGYIDEYPVTSQGYDDFLYDDISELMPILKDSEIVDKEFLRELEVKIKDRVLNKSEKLMCLHLAETMRLADEFCD